MSQTKEPGEAARLFVACLEQEGIRHMFGLPGEENADLMLALETSSIEFIMTRHEQGAAFMAEFYGRLTGSPAACLSTLGPGATNLLTAIADANMDRSPVLAIAGQGAIARLHKESHQIIDIERLFAPVTKWSHAIRTASSIPEVVRKAVRIARSEKPGAVVLELPEDIASSSVEAEPLKVTRFRRPVPEPEQIETAWDKIRQAERPLIIAGNGAIRTRASAELRRFCDQTGIGVVSTFMGKGAVDMDAPTCLFTIGLSQTDHVLKAVKTADVLVTVGYDMVEYPPELWKPHCHAEIIHIDFYAAEIDSFYQPDLELVGDIAGAFQQLNDHVERDGVPHYDLAIQHQVRETMLAEFAAHSQDETEGTVRPQKAVWDARNALGRSDIVLSGVGAHKMWVARYYQCHEPNTCLIPNGFCSMGAALPGAIGAKIARPQSRVLAIVGDGDFLMNVQEMETASRLGSDIAVMVWVDEAYGLIEWKQQDSFGRHTDLSFTNPDWKDLARAFGWHCEIVERSSDLKEALDRALDHAGPALVAVAIDYRENAQLSERLGQIEMPI